MNADGESTGETAVWLSSEEPAVSADADRDAAAVVLLGRGVRTVAGVGEGVGDGAGVGAGVGVGVGVGCTSKNAFSFS